MSVAPCRGCTKRCAACHDACEEYAGWKAERTKIYNMQHKSDLYKKATYKNIYNEYRTSVENRLREQVGT